MRINRYTTDSKTNILNGTRYTPRLLKGVLLCGHSNMVVALYYCHTALGSAPLYLQMKPQISYT